MSRLCVSNVVWSLLLVIFVGYFFCGCSGFHSLIKPTFLNSNSIRNLKPIGLLVITELCANCLFDAVYPNQYCLVTARK